jgi:hypothetical protein
MPPEAGDAVKRAQAANAEATHTLVQGAGKR